MNTIVQQICEKFIGEVAEYFSQDKMLALSEMETALKKKSDAFLLDLIKTYLEQLNEAVLADRAGRRRQGIVVERHGDKREQYLSFGMLSFERTYFYDKRKRSYTYLVDRAVGLESYGRVSQTVAVDLVDHAVESSYAESSRHVTGGAVSRQTVMKKLRRLDGLQVLAPSEQRRVTVLHVNADEDHLTLQDGSRTIVPLISIHEGIEHQGKRGRCQNAHYISSHGKPIEELWLEAAQWIDQAYDAEALERVYLHGDGAAWIKEGLNWLPNARLVLDRYHLNKALIVATGKQPVKRAPLYRALSQGDQGAAAALLHALEADAKENTERKRAREFRRYIERNWSGIAIYNQEPCGGSCTEGHVSHVLSKRLSSRPMSWSRAGLRVMAELRAYKSSGGKIEAKHLQQSVSPYKIKKSVLKQAQRSFTQTAKERFDNVTILSRGKVVPLFHLLRGLQSGKAAL